MKISRKLTEEERKKVNIENTVGILVSREARKGVCRRVTGTDMYMELRILMGKTCDHIQDIILTPEAVFTEEDTEETRKDKVNMLFDIAVKNNEKLFRNFVVKMPENDIPYDTGMSVVTNEAALCGANAILDRRIRKELTEMYDTEEFIVYPSSVHEMIVIPAADERGKEAELAGTKGIVRQINAECVDPEERLSDKAYYFNAKKGTFKEIKES